MSQLEPISILFLTFPEVAQAMWWVAQAMWSGLRRLCGGSTQPQAGDWAWAWTELGKKHTKGYG